MFDSWIDNFDCILIIRMIIAALCGLAVGYERKFQLKSAGVKTHFIVAISSTLMMEVSKYGFFDTQGADGARIAAQVVSGISFLGAGIIIKRNQNVEGLTTAAGIWMMSGIGLAIGSGMYFVGISCTVLYLLFHLFVRWIDKKFNLHQIGYVIYIKDVLFLYKILKPYKNSKIIGCSIEKEEDGWKLEMTVIFKQWEHIVEWENQVICTKTVSTLERIT